MTGGVLGGGVIFVIAALLWGAVLVPNWARRREFRAAEKNALRLQRTLRLLAETSEVPQEVRLEATAREALAHERMLRTAQKRQDAERRAELAEAEAEQVRAEIRARQMQRKQAAAERSAKLRKPVARRVRATAALGALLGLIGLLVGAGFAIGGSGASLLIGSAALLAASSGALVLLAPGRARVRAVPAEQVTTAIATAVVESAPQIVNAPATASEAAAAAAHAEAQRAAAERIELARARARARAERPAPQENQTDSMLLREVRKQLSQAVETAPDPRAAAASAAAEEQARQQAQAAEDARLREQARQRELRAQQQEASDRLRNMGVVGDTATGMPDLDAVLRRRRNAG